MVSYYYPGLVIGSNYPGLVYGEVYAFEDATNVLSILDDYEGCGNQFESPDEYRREEAEVIMTDNTRLICWVYIYNRPIQNSMPKIESGRFTV